MNALWWNSVRMQLGLERLRTNEAMDQFLSLSLFEIEEWMFCATYGHIEESNIHPYNDARFWLSTR